MGKSKQCPGSTEKQNFWLLAGYCHSSLPVVAWVTAGEPVRVVHTPEQPDSSAEPSRGETAPAG